VGDLETLEVIETIGFFSNDIESEVNELSTLSEVNLGPVVTRTSLTEDEFFRSVELIESFNKDGVHCSWFKIHE
jgi:hypothetical protein